MSRERKNDRHVPLGPARRLVPRPSNASVSSSHPKGVTVVREAKHRETLGRMLSQSRFSRARRFFVFLRMRSSLIPVRCRFPDCRRSREGEGGTDSSASLEDHRKSEHSPPLFASHRDVTQKRTSEMVRADPTTVRGVRLPPLAEPSRRRSPPRRRRVARSRVVPLDSSRRRRQSLTGAPRPPHDRRKPFSPRPSSPSRRRTPMSTPSCRRRSSGRCASRPPRSRTRRAAARSTCFRLSPFPNLATVPPHGD